LKKRKEARALNRVMRNREDVDRYGHDQLTASKASYSTTRAWDGFNFLTMKLRMLVHFITIPPCFLCQPQFFTIFTFSQSSHIYIYIYIYIMMNFVFELNHHHHHCCCFRYYVIIHFITSIYIWIFKTCEAFYWIVMDENFEVMTDMNFNFASIC
jgi:hypothetical protein